MLDTPDNAACVAPAMFRLKQCREHGTSKTERLESMIDVNATALASSSGKAARGGGQDVRETFSQLRTVQVRRIIRTRSLTGTTPTGTRSKFAKRSRRGGSDGSHTVNNLLISCIS